MEEDHIETNQNEVKKTKISDLPPEVLMKILDLLDGKSRDTMSSVSSQWFPFLEKEKNCQSLWKRYCQREINPQVLQQMVSSLQLDVTFDWRRIYYLWHCSLNFSQSVRPMDIISLSTETRICQCRLICGRYIVVSTYDGGLHLHDSTTLQRFDTVAKPPSFVARAIHPLFPAGSSAHWPHFICFLHNCKIAAWKVSPIHKLSDLGKVVYQNGCYSQLEVSGDQFAALTLNRYVEIYKVTSTGDPSTVNISHRVTVKIPGSSNAMGLEGDQLTLMELRHGVCSFRSASLTDSPPAIEHNLGESTPTLLRCEIEPVLITSYFNTLWFCQAPMQHLTISSDHFATCHSIATQSEVRALSFWGSFLALGLANGHVYLYSIPLLEATSYHQHIWNGFVDAAVISIDVNACRNDVVLLVSRNAQIKNLRIFRFRLTCL